MRCMNLEPIAQGKVSQREKDECCVLRHVYVELRKTVQPIHRQQRRQTEGTEPWTQPGRRGWDELREEQGSMSITSGDLKGDAGSSAPFHQVLDVTCK